MVAEVTKFKCARISQMATDNNKWLKVETEKSNLLRCSLNTLLKLIFFFVCLGDVTQRKTFFRKTLNEFLKVLSLNFSLSNNYLKKGIVLVVKLPKCQSHIVELTLPHIKKPWISRKNHIKDKNFIRRFRVSVRIRFFILFWTRPHWPVM